MRGYLGRRLLAAPLVLLGVLTLTFLLVHAAPGSPFSFEQTAGMDPGAAARLRRLFGQDDPVAVRYARWLAAFVTGDLGVSLTSRRPVSEVLAGALPATLLLASSALLASIAAGIPAACLAAAARGRLARRALAAAASAIYAAPPFWIGVLLIAAVSVGAGWLPASGMRDVDAARLGWAARTADLARHLALPCVTLAAPGAAAVALLLQGELAAALRSDYARAARARGAGRLSVMLRHALRNAITPIVTLVALGLPGLVGGALVVEVLFAWPGMGRIAYQAILARDTPVVVGATALAAAMTLAGSLIADLIYMLLDPRAGPAGRPDTGGVARSVA